MNGKCFEIGTIQAFLDGETTPDVSLRLTDHVSACDTCARVMADAEEETSLVFSTLERELNSLVPTQRLWSRINETIEVEKSRTPIWHKVLVFVRVTFANPSISVAAGILLVLGMFALLITVPDGNSSGLVTVDPVQPSSQVASAQNETVSISTTGGDPVIPSPSTNAGIRTSNLKSTELGTLAASVRAGPREIRPQYAVDRATAADGYLPGEESYVKTISELKQNVDDQKDTVLTPSTRVSYERDMAVVNDSIKRMREVVEKNPRNQAARQVLYSSYQDKIDLLNSVAQREELMASLR